MKKVILPALMALVSVFAHAQPEWKRINYTQSTIFHGEIIADGFTTSATDFVGAFVNGECRMLAPVRQKDGGAYVSAVVHTEKPEEVVLKYWKSATGEIFESTSGFETVPHGEMLDFPIKFKADATPEAAEKATGKTITVEPNPVDDFFTVSSASIISELQIFCGAGVSHGTVQGIDSASIELSASGLVAGKYIISVLFADGSIGIAGLVKN
jgi:hypothetical protein